MELRVPPELTESTELKAKMVLTVFQEEMVPREPPDPLDPQERLVPAVPRETLVPRDSLELRD